MNLLRGLLIGWVCLSFGTGCITLRTGPLQPASAPIPPNQEIEILDPQQGKDHVPPILINQDSAGNNKVEIPPTVLVHRYYPTGDRSFQAQFLPGGPTLLAINHPKTLERVYVPVMMPPGAPRVFYSGNTIIYDYGPQSVTVRFGLLGQPTVTYSNDTKIADRIRTAVNNTSERISDWRESRRGE